MLSLKKFKEIFNRDYGHDYDWDMFWEGQYALHFSGYRGSRLHDITLLIMAGV